MGAFRRRLPTLVIGALALALVAIVGRFDSTGVIGSGGYSASSGVTLTSNAASAVADTTYTVHIDGGQPNFSEVTVQFPGAACLAPGPESAAVDCAAGLRPQLGDVVGTFSSSVFFGLTNTPCSANLTVTFIFLNATVDNSPGNEIYPSAQMQADSGGTLSPLLQDVNGVGPGIGQSQAGAVSPSNGLPGHVDRYPSYLNKVFDPDGAGPQPPLQPHARYSGGQVVAGTSVVLTIPVFAPGAFGAFAQDNATHPYADMAATNLGYVAVPVLQDPTAAQAPSSITDFCTPVDLSTLLFGESRQNPCNGGPGGPNPNPVLCNNDGIINNPTPGAPIGRIRWQNPAAAGTHYFGTYQYSQRDSDADGIENSFDTCPRNSNTDGDPRVNSGPDGDMLDSSCDPGPATNNPNQDGDTAPTGAAWTNAGDNCPLNANPTQTESERSEPDNVSRPRGGPATDSLGDECDGPETACGAAVDDDGDGLMNDGCPTVGTATAEINCGFSTSAEVDNDRDSYPNDGCPAAGVPEPTSACQDSVNNDAFNDTRINDGCPAAAAPETGAQCTNAIDDDGDTLVNDGCPKSGYAAEPEAVCQNYVSDDDDNGDTVINSSDVVNDGCPAMGGAELGCLNTADDDADGAFNDGCASSGRVANGHFHTDFDLLPVCIGATDADADGYCAAPSIGVPADPADNDGNRTPETYSQFRPFYVAHSGSGNNPPASREPLQVCNDGIDNDGDGLVDLLDGTSIAATTTDDCRPPDSVFTTGKDTDGECCKDEVEIHVGTDALARCGVGFSSGPSKAHPYDLRDDSAFTADKVNVSDLGTYTAQGKNNKAPNEAGFDRRWDVRPGSTFGQDWVNVADLSAVSSNVPVPWMGVRGFGFFSVCSAHPVYND